MRLFLSLLLLGLALPASVQIASAQSASPRTADELAREARNRSFLHFAVPLLAGTALGALDGVGEPGVLAFAGAVATAYGVLVGPSMGAFHLGDDRRAWTGVALRGTGQAATGVGLVLMLDGIFSGDNDSRATAGALIGLGGVALLLGGIGYSFATIPVGAREQAVRLGAGYDAVSGRPVPGLVVSSH